MCRQHELELCKDKADVELLKMHQGLSATLNVAPVPEKAVASPGSAGSEAAAALEQRLQLLQEEATQLRETIVKQVHACPGQPGHTIFVTDPVSRNIFLCHSALSTCCTISQSVCQERL